MNLTTELERTRVAMSITRLPCYIKSIKVMGVESPAELEDDKEVTIWIEHMLGNHTLEHTKQFLVPHDAVIEHGSMLLDYNNHPEGWILSGTRKNGKSFSFTAD